MLVEQDTQFNTIMNDSKNSVGDVEDINDKIHALATRYYEASENAEKYIFNYQEIKLNMEIPLINR